MNTNLGRTGKRRLQGLLSILFIYYFSQFSGWHCDFIFLCWRLLLGRGAFTFGIVLFIREEGREERERWIPGWVSFVDFCLFSPQESSLFCSWVVGGDEFGVKDCVVLC